MTGLARPISCDSMEAETSCDKAFFFHDGIVVQEPDQVRSCFKRSTDPHIVSPGEAHISTVSDQMDFGVPLPDRFGRSVRRPVVHDDHIEIGVIGANEGIQAFQCVLEPVPVRTTMLTRGRIALAFIPRFASIGIRASGRPDPCIEGRFSPLRVPRSRSLQPRCPLQAFHP